MILTLLAACLVAMSCHAGTFEQVIYDFDETITSQHVFQELRHLDGKGNRVSVHDQMEALASCTPSRVEDMFGGAARILHLHAHLKHLTSHGIHIGIISMYSSREVILKTLEMMDLMQYFSADKIVAKEVGKESAWQDDELQAMKIRQIRKHFSQVPPDKTLFIDDDSRNPVCAQSQGVAKAAGFLLGAIGNGLTEKQMEWISHQIV